MFDVFISDVINVTECWDHSVGVGEQISMSADRPLIGHCRPLIGRSGLRVFFTEI